MSAPEVSVLIPCYNAEKYIGETLESVLRQTWPNIQIVIADDGSTDRGVDEIIRFSRPNLVLIRQENRGQTAALNECLTRATGAFVQYLDADDLLSATKIEKQLARLADNPVCVASAEWGRFYGLPDEARFEPEPVWRDLLPLDWLALSRADGLGMMFPALWLIPMPIVRSAGPWVEGLTLNNDAEYFTRILLLAERVLFCAGARCYYRSGLPGSLSGRKSASAWASQSKVIELCQQRVLAREDSDRMRRGFSLTWQHLAHSVYPYDRNMAAHALAHARALHAVRIRPDGGPVFRMLSRLIGWRAARRIQVASGRP